MSRLDKYAKEAFVKAVLDDVPSVDYDEQAKKLVQDHARDTLPPKVRAIYDDASLRHFLAAKYINTPGRLQSVTVLQSPEWVCSDEVKAKLRELSEAEGAQRESRRALEHKLDGIIATCTTVKKAHELLPEFSKYLPPLEGGTPNVPAVANVVTDLMNAGWPKDKKKGAKA